MELKQAEADGDASKTTNDALTRKIQLLEEELDAAEKNAKETMEKYVTCPRVYRLTLNARALVLVG